MGRRALNQITTEELRRIQVMFKAKDKWSNGTINRHFAFLRHVLMVEIRDGKLERNPITGLRFLPEEKTTRFFSDDELNTLKKEIPAPDWKLIEFAVETGLRREEQFRLRWDQVDLETAILTIPLPKGGKTRHVPLSDRALEILRALDSFMSSPWVFPNPKQPLRGRNAQSFVNHVFTPALLNTRIEGTCWHTLRHTAASRRVMAGVDLVSVKEILGHRDIQTTLRYAHLAPGHLKDAVNRGSLGTATSKVSKS
jgi:integrase